MNKLIKTIVVLAALAAPLASFGAVQKGLKEVDVVAAYSNLDMGGTDLDLLLATGSFGYFFTDNLEAKTSLSYLHADLSGTGDIDVLLAGLGGDFHFNTQSDFVPFAGASIYYAWADMSGASSEDDWAWEVRAGIKQFVASNVAITYQVSYISFDDLDLDGFNVGLGLSYFF